MDGFRLSERLNFRFLRRNLRTAIFLLLLTEICLKKADPDKACSSMFSPGENFPKIWVGVCGALLETLGANHLASEGGGSDFEKKISCKCICVRKNFLRKTIVPKSSRTYSGLEKKFWQDVSWVDTLNFISRLLKDFSIWTWVRGILCTMMFPFQVAFSLHL